MLETRLASIVLFESGLIVVGLFWFILEGGGWALVGIEPVLVKAVDF